jgi:hypothetical protein
MKDKRKLLDLAFNCNDKKAIKELTLGAGKILNERLSNLSPIECEIAIGKLTDSERNDYFDYLRKETGREYIDYSTWTAEQLEERLLELNNEIEIERMLQNNPETLSNEQLEKCLEYLCMKEGKPYKKLDLSTWTNEQLKAELLKLNNKSD